MKVFKCFCLCCVLASLMSIPWHHDNSEGLRWCLERTEGLGLSLQWPWVQYSQVTQLCLNTCSEVLTTERHLLAFQNSEVKAYHPKASHIYTPSGKLPAGSGSLPIAEAFHTVTPSCILFPAWLQTPHAPLSPSVALKLTKISICWIFHLLEIQFLLLLLPGVSITIQMQKRFYCFLGKAVASSKSPKCFY